MYIELFKNHFIKVAAGAVIACSIVSCSKEVKDVLPEEESPRLSFSVRSDVESTTKGETGITLSSLRTRGFGVSAYWRDDKGFFDGIDDSHVYFKNHAVTFLSNEGTYDRWACNPVEYWPLNSTLSFFAYAPYMASSDPMLELPTSDSSTLPRGRFTQKTDVSQQVDFCLSAPALDRSADGGEVPLVFNHALTQIRLYVNVKGVSTDVSNLKYRLESVRWDGLVGANSFTYGGSVNGFHWDELPRSDLAKRAASYTLTRSAGQLADAALPAIGYYEHSTNLSQYLFVNSSQAGTMYLLPQPITSKGELVLSLKGYTVSGSTWTLYDDHAPVTVKLPIETVWKPGTIVTYTLTIDVNEWKEIEFNVSLTEWGSASHSFVIPIA